MSHLIEDCPRCGSQRITFDVVHIQVEQKKPASYAEAHAICRECKLGSIFKLLVLPASNSLFQIPILEIDFSQNMSLASVFYITGHVSLVDENVSEPPAHLPVDVESIYKEAAVCLTSGCFNAAAAMYRLILDKVTKNLLKNEISKVEYELNSERRARLQTNLASRLNWLFEIKVIPANLKDLSICIKDDGNDGAHDGTLTISEAEDLEDFIDILLEHIYTIPKQLELAKERRAERRSKIS